MPLLIGIAGGTGSGKTTLAAALKGYIGETRSYIIFQDAYYKDRRALEFLKREELNFDQPEAFDFPLLIEHLRRLKSGEAVEIPVYDYKGHTRSREKLRVLPQGFIILEGILVLADETVRSLLDLKIYVDTSPQVRFQRRLARDIKERGRTEDSVREQYQATVLPMHLKYIEPSRQFADIVVSGEENIEELWRKIEPKLKKYL